MERRVVQASQPFYDQPDAELLAILGENNLGVANVTWRFEPVERAGR